MVVRPAELYEESYDRYFDLPYGTIGVMADIYADGDTLVLENLSIYPVAVDRVELGIRSVLAIRRLIEEDARQLGFSRLRITGMRLTGASPRRSVNVGRNLR